MSPKHINLPVQDNVIFLESWIEDKHSSFDLELLEELKACGLKEHFRCIALFAVRQKKMFDRKERLKKRSHPA